MENIRKASIERTTEGKIMAGISKKKTTKGIKYTITYRDVFGKQHTSGLYDTIKEAKKHLHKFEEINPETQNITYGMIFKYYFERANSKYAINTIANYQRYYNTYFLKVSDIKYDKITSIMWQSFFDDIEKTSAYIAQGCLKMAKAAVNYCIKHGLLEYNVFDKVEKIELPKPDINHLTIEEIKQVLAECKCSYNEYYALLYTFIGTGAREGEIFALTKNDFNFEEKTLSISKQFTKNRLVLKTKTESSNRKIYIFDELAEVLKMHITRLDKDNPLLFPNKAGNYLNSNNLRKRFWYPLLKLCDINKRVRLHDLRGSYIDMVLSNGLSIKFAQNQVGHAKSETTLNVYARNNKDMIEKATIQIGSIFSKKCENNVRIKNELPEKKIIHFPKRSVDTVF